MFIDIQFMVKQSYRLWISVNKLPHGYWIITKVSKTTQMMSFNKPIGPRYIHTALLLCFWVMLCCFLTLVIVLYTAQIISIIFGTILPPSCAHVTYICNNSFTKTSDRVARIRCEGRESNPVTLA